MNYYHHNPHRNVYSCNIVCGWLGGVFGQVEVTWVAGNSLGCLGMAMVASGKSFWLPLLSGGQGLVAGKVAGSIFC